MDPGARQSHWDGVHAAREEEALTWFEALPAQSLAVIGRSLEPGGGGAIIDIGGGTSRLADSLLERGYGPLTVLDISPAAIEASRARLGPKAGSVTWIPADITRWRPEAQWAFWHDRAVFHFLTEGEDRAAYVAAMTMALRPGGHALIATFADDGPETCSGLPVRRYSPKMLFAEIDARAPGAFDFVDGQHHVHKTPKGNRQNFQLSLLRRRGAVGK